MKLRQRKCKACGEWFMPFNSLQKSCRNPACILDVYRQDEAKRERKELRAARERIKTRREWMKEAQDAFNAWVRERDAHLSCISCDKPASWSGQWHASHYRPAGKNAELRFDPSNVHKACSECNNFKSGNLTEYRLGLIARCGMAEVERLERTYAPKRWTIEELKEIKATYCRMLRELKARKAA